MPTAGDKNSAIRCGIARAFVTVTAFSTLASRCPSAPTAASCKSATNDDSNQGRNTLSTLSTAWVKMFRGWIKCCSA